MRTEFELNLDPECKPRFCKKRTLPYVLKEQNDEELDRLLTIFMNRFLSLNGLP